MNLEDKIKIPIFDSISDLTRNSISFYVRYYIWESVWPFYLTDVRNSIKNKLDDYVF